MLRSAKPSKKNTRKKATDAVPILDDATKDALLDFLAFVLFALATYLGVCLASYHPQDASLLTLNQGLVQNHGGRIGAGASDFLMRTLGYGAYVIPFFLLCITLWFAFFPKKAFRPWVLVGTLCLLIGGCLGLSLIQNIHAESYAGFMWGGSLGQNMKALFTPMLGRFGSALMDLTLILIGLRFTLGLSFKHLVQGFQDMFARLGSTLKKFSQSFWLKAAGLCALLKTTWTRRKKTPSNPLDGKDEGVGRVESYTPKTSDDDLEGPSPSELSIKDKLNARIQRLQDTTHALERDEENTDPIHNQDTPAHGIKIREGGIEDMDRLSDMPEAHLDELLEDDALDATHYELPNLNLLQSAPGQELDIDRDALVDNAKRLEEKLKHYNIQGKVTEVQPGPVVTMYEFEPAPGVKVAQVTRLSEDLSLALKAISVRIAPIPGKSVIGIEVANTKRQVVYLRDILNDEAFEQSKSKLTLALGQDIAGHSMVGDLRKMPHLLIAGATGSGKSVSINSVLLSVLFKSTPDDVRMILVDPKMLELSLYNEIPHLLLPVVTNPKKAAAALDWAVKEMERRYRMMSDLSVRNVEGYNSKVETHIEELANQDPSDVAENPSSLTKDEVTHEGRLPLIMIVIDELADLMMVSSKEVEESIIRLAQMARAAGIHLLLATQRPSVDVITGVIKANMPSRISFQVSSKIDSRTILDTNGAETLLGAGDMLFMPPGSSKIMRLHGAFVSDKEVENVTNYWKTQGKPQYKKEIMEATEKALEPKQDSDKKDEDPDDELYYKAIDLAKAHGVASISMIQRRLRIGYNRAARLVERMDDEGLLQPGGAGKPRALI